MAMTSHVWTAVRAWSGARERWSWSWSAGLAGIDRLASETLKRPVVKSGLVSAVAALLTFVVGSVAWIDLNSHLTTRDALVVAGVREFTLWPVFWLALAVFAVVVSLHVLLTRPNNDMAYSGKPLPSQTRKNKPSW